MFSDCLLARGVFFHEAHAQERSLHTLQELFEQRVNGLYLLGHLFIVER